MSDAREDPNNICTLYTQAKSIRSVREPDWRLAAAHCLPSHYASWQTEGPAFVQSVRTGASRVAFDTTGARSLGKYTAILHRLLTPDGQRWHTLRASDDALMRKKRVAQYFDDWTKLLFKSRYHPKARFKTSFAETYRSLGVYGNGPLFIGERKPTHVDSTRGVKYISCAMRDIFVLTDDEGEVYAFFRRMYLNARQFKLKFPNASLPPQIENELKMPTPSETKFFEIVHFVRPRTKDYDPTALDIRRHKIVGSYVFVEGKTYVGEDEGYLSMPYKMPRTETMSGDPYGDSPAVLALASLGGASAIKKTNLKQGNKAVDPVLLAHDDAAMNGTVDLRPGAINYGGVDRNGRATIQVLPTGNFQVGELLLQDERRDIEDSFFVTLFQILTETPEMTATEVIERMAEKAALLAPTMGRGQSELLGPTIEREIDIHAELGLAPEMPPELVEAQGEYEVTYTSPLARSMNAEEISGFARSLEMSIGVANVTQDVSIFDHYDFDAAIPEINDTLSVPPRWTRSMDAVKKLRDGRQSQQDVQTAVEAAPAAASVLKTMGAQ